MIIAIDDMNTLCSNKGMQIHTIAAIRSEVLRNVRSTGYELTKPIEDRGIEMLFSENLSKQDIQKIKKVAVDLLQKVKSKIAELDHWTDKQETKATIDTLIRDTLWLELPECYDELRISEYRQRIYEYVYTRYKGVA